MAKIRFLDQVPIGVFATNPNNGGGITSGSFTGSFSGSFTGSLQGTASFAISSSYAATASLAPNYTLLSTFNNFTSSFRSGSFTGSFTGSLFGTSSYASFSITSSYGEVNSVPFRINYKTSTFDDSLNVFLVTINTQTLFTVKQNGIAVFNTQSSYPTSSALNGGIYFTSESLFIGVD